MRLVASASLAAATHSGRLTLPRNVTAMPAATLDEQLANVVYNEAGLVPAIAQDHETGTVLMLAWMTEATLRETLETGRMVYWSRSRKEVWRKGDTSGDIQLVREARYDCDGDVLLFVVEQQGKGACHTGEFSCFFRAFSTPTSPSPTSPCSRSFHHSKEKHHA